MKKTLKIIGIAAGGIVVLAVILVLSAAFLIPWDKVKDKLVEKASQELKREVRIEKLSFGLLKGLELEGFYVGNAAGFSPGAFISADTAVLKYDFWALFKRQVKLTKIELVKPFILIEKGKNERYNFSDLLELSGKKAEKEAPVRSKNTELPVEFSISRFAVVDGTVKYSDETVKPAGSLDVKKINVSVSGLSLESVKPFFITASASVIYNKAPLDLAIDGTMELQYKEQRFKADKLSAKIPSAGMELTADVEVNKFLENPELKLNAVLSLNGEKSLKLLGEMASKEQKKYLNELGMAGTASLKLNLAGSMVKTPKDYAIKANCSGSADITKMELKYSTYFLKPGKYPLVIDYKLDMNGEKVNLNAELKMRDSALKTRVELAGFEAPRISADLDGEVLIAELYSLLPVMEGFEASGKAKFTGNIKVPVKKDYSVDYKGIAIDIKGRILDFGTQYSKFKYGVSKLNADLALNEKILELRNLVFSAGSSPFKGSLSAANFNLETLAEWKTRFTGDVKFELTCQKYLLDELMAAVPEKKAGPAPANSKAGKTAETNPGFSNEELAEYINYLDPGLKVDGRALLKEVVYKKVKLTDVSAALKLAGRKAGVDSSVNAYSGAVKSKINLDMNTPGLGYELKAEINNVQAGDFINALVDSFLKPDIGANFKDKIFGSTVAGIEIKGAGVNKNAVKKNLTAKLSYKLVNGRLKNWKILGDALAALKLNRMEEINFREFTGTISAANQKASIENFRIICDDMRYTASGEVNYDKDLDSSMNLKFLNDLSPNSAKQLGDLGFYGSDENGWFPVDFMLAGTLARPALPAPLLERSQKNMENKLKKKAEEELKKKGEDLKQKGLDLLKGLFGR